MVFIALSDLKKRFLYIRNFSSWKGKRRGFENNVPQGLRDHHEHSVKVEEQVLDHQPTDLSPPKHERRCMRRVPAQALCSHVAVCVPNMKNSLPEFVFR